MDAMVTARMPIEKKQQGNEILASLGKTPSRLISELYDYLISERQLPDLSSSAKHAGTSEEKQKLYQAFLASTVLPVPEEFWEQNPEDETELLTAALEEKYGSLA